MTCFQRRSLRVGIDGDDLAGPPRERADLVHEVLREEPLRVVLDDDGVEVGQHRLELRDRLRVADRRRRETTLAVHAHDMLLAGDDPRLDDGLVIVGLLDAVQADFPGREQPLEDFRVQVVAEQAHHRDVVGELAQVARDVGRAAGIVGLGVDIDDRHGGLGRDAADPAPDELVEHQVTDDEDAFGTEAVDQRREGQVMRHTKFPVGGMNQRS